MGSLIVALATDWAVLALVQNMVTWSMGVDIKYDINSLGMAVNEKMPPICIFNFKLFNYPINE